MSKESEKTPLAAESQATFVLSSKSAPDDKISLWSRFFLSNWFFIWVFPIIKVGRQKDIHKLKLKLREQETSRVNVDLLEANWKAECAANPKQPSMLTAVKKTFGREYMMIAGYKLTWTFFTWAGAWYLLKMMLQFLSVNGRDLPEEVGHYYAIALLLAGLFSSIAIHQQYAECNRVGVKVKSAVMGIIYRKSLRLSRVKGGAGAVINILTGDVGRINEAVVNFHFLWSAFVEVAIILAISIYEIRLSALPAVGWILLLLPIQMYLGKRTDSLGRHQAKETTERVHVMSELLTAIKLIKFYAWEMPFASKITAIRVNEMSYIYSGLINKVINYTVVFAIPVLVALSSLSMYVALGNKLTAAVTFSVLSVFNTLRYPFFMLPMAVKATVGAIAAMDRVDEFMALEEVIELKPSPLPAGSDLAVELYDCDFKWDGQDSDKPTISNISIKVKRGSKVAIVGHVGSGKSSILAALLGQIRHVRGDTVKVYGSTAYMSQEAWLLNMTLRENVLFGQPMDKARFNEVIRVAGLERDLTLLVAGDQTEIAERGANLSGGQRQRVSLARSIYYNADIVLLDDPLSAVDQHVGRHIFEECFQKHLKDKTVIIAINQLQYLNQMDHIIFVEDGKIVGQGSYDDLMENNSEFSTLVHTHVSEDVNYEVQDEVPEENDFKNSEIPAIKVEDMIELNNLSVMSRGQLSAKSPRAINENTIRSLLELQHNTSIYGAEKDHDIAKIIARNELSQHLPESKVKELLAASKDAEDDEAAKKRGKLVQDDESTKTAGFGDFVAYARSGSGSVVTCVMALFFLVVHAVRIGGDFWLRLWVPRVGNFSDATYVGVYGAFTAVFTIGAFYRGYIFTRVTSRKANELHDKLFDSAIHAPMSFYDTTPIARILSCFSKHQLHVDDTMLDAGLQALQYFPLGFYAFMLCVVTVPWNFIPCIVIIFLGVGIIKISNPADMTTKNLEAVTKPPIYSHVTATLEGLMSIRSYHVEDRFDSLNLAKLDTNHEALFAMQNVKSFQALYLDVLSSFVIYFTALLLIFQRDVPAIDSVAGLALSNALQMLVFVQWTVRQWGDVETQMSSVGQLVYYGKIQPEAPFEIPDKKPDPSWPQQGLIKFTGIELKYQKFGVSVLKNINLTIYPQEKIGIVGRTGSGKSTLLISLLRIVEPCNGTITIDGLDVSGIGLHDLRNQVAIIPQEPVMFVGTIRSNLDPFNKSTDEEIWKALDAVFLGEQLRKAPKKLETAVTENGKSVSQGQRQLLCIARAILSKAKVLVLDEATASLDAQTDLMIQEAIKTNFAEMTLLTIAHRLNTIIESDRVLVMDAGCLKEFDEPIRLLEKEDGIFRNLVDQTGEGGSQKLREIAQQAHDQRVARGYSFPQNHETNDTSLGLKEIAAGVH